MATTRATAIGHDWSGRSKERTALGWHSAEATAATWHTFATVTVRPDGSGQVKVTQNERVIHTFCWGSENVIPTGG